MTTIQQQKYCSRWRSKAAAQEARQKRGKFLDRRERRLIQKYVSWKADQTIQRTQAERVAESPEAA